MLWPRSSHGRELRPFMKRCDALVPFNLRIHRPSFLYIRDSLPFGSPGQLPGHNCPCFLRPPWRGIYASDRPDLIRAKAWYPNVVLSFQHHL